MTEKHRLAYSDAPCTMLLKIEHSHQDQPQRLSVLNRLFYLLKPVIPRPTQLFIRRKMVLHRRARYEHLWPIDKSARATPKGWPGWPDKKKFAFTLMHDVDTQAGHDKCRRLMDLEEKLGFRSTFNFVPERYNIEKSLLEEVKARGFGLGVHGLKHDGKLFSSRTIFSQRAKRINMYLADWGTKGFSSPSMHRNLRWMPELEIDYATCTFDTDPFEPQPQGIGTIFPFWVPGDDGHRGYFELPYTLPQDFTLFILMREQNTRIWETKLNWIAAHGGMALLNTHPDYMCFGGQTPKAEEYPVTHYENFLLYLKTELSDAYWHTLPKGVADYLISADCVDSQTG